MKYRVDVTDLEDATRRASDSENAARQSNGDPLEGVAIDAPDSIADEVEGVTVVYEDVRIVLTSGPQDRYELTVSDRDGTVFSTRRRAYRHRQ